MAPYGVAAALPADARPARGRARASRTTGRPAPRCCTTALRRLARRLGASPPLNLWVRTAPRGAEHFCWRIDVVPRLTHLAGLELGTGRAPQHRRARAGGGRAARGLSGARARPARQRARRSRVDGESSARSAPGCSCCSASTHDDDAEQRRPAGRQGARAARSSPTPTGRMNEPLGDREVLCVSQFTLYGDSAQGQPAQLRGRRAARASPSRSTSASASALGAARGVVRRAHGGRARQRRAGDAGARGVSRARRRSWWRPRWRWACAGCGGGSSGSGGDGSTTRVHRAAAADPSRPSIARSAIGRGAQRGQPRGGAAGLLDLAARRSPRAAAPRGDVARGPQLGMRRALGRPALPRPAEAAGGAQRRRGARRYVLLRCTGSSRGAEAPLGCRADAADRPLRPPLRRRAAAGDAALRPLGAARCAGTSSRPACDIDTEGEDLGEPGDVAWFPDRTWSGRTYVPATAPTANGYELFGYVSFVAGDDGPRGRRASTPSADFTDRDGRRNPDWKIDLSDEVIGRWRGEQGKVADDDAGLGRPARRRRRDRDRRAGRPRRRPVRARRGPLHADRARRLPRRLPRGPRSSTAAASELARESLYEDDEEAEARRQPADCAVGTRSAHLLVGEREVAGGDGRRPSLGSSSGSSLAAERPATFGQRVWKRHAGGGFGRAGHVAAEQPRGRRARQRAGRAPGPPPAARPCRGGGGGA